MQPVIALLNDHGVNATPEVLVPDLPEPVFFVSIAGSQALPVWQLLREHVHDTGYWPIIFGDDEEVQIFRSWIPEDGQHLPPPRTQIAQSQSIHAQEALRQALLFNCGDQQDPEVAEYFASLRGVWPEHTSGLTTFSILHKPIEHTLYPQIALGFVPTTISWQVPAFLYYGDWNECPPSTHHCAILRYWQDR
jgi:hypothetical protein